MFFKAANLEIGLIDYLNFKNPKNEAEEMKKILVCDNDNNCNEQLWDIIIVWNQYSANIFEKNKIFISELVEQNDSKLKKRYLEWLHEFGEFYVGNKKIKEHFVLHDDYSYWWSTIIAQKANFYEAKNIVNALKLFQLSEIFGSEGVKITKLDHLLYIDLNDYDLVKVFENYSKIQKIKFYNLSNTLTKKSTLWPYNSFIFHFIKSILYLKHKFFLWIIFLRKDKSKKKSNEKVDILLFDILVYLENIKGKAQKFQSKYWTKLISVVESVNRKTLFAHLFFKHKDISSIKKANSILHEYNFYNKKSKHALVDKEIIFKSFVKIIIRYIKLCHLYFKYDYKIKNLWENSDFDFYPLFKNNWKHSFFGIHMMKVLFHTELFKNMLNKYPRINLGIYVMENQPWELALLYYWKKNQHGTIIGFPNSTLRYWDMRYFYHYLTLLDKSKHSLPQPDIIAVNGFYAKELLLSHSFPHNKIKVVEALRYLYLESFKCFHNRDFNKNSKVVILILGSNLTESNRYLLDIIKDVPIEFKSEFCFIYKPHSAVRERNSQLDFVKLTNEDLSDLLFYADIVVCSSSTSSSIDSIYAGRPTLILKDPKMLNISPVRGIINVTYFYDVFSFINIITQLKNIRKNLKTELNYFHLDLNLKAWRDLLSEYVD
jgi:surface carbohydrate biosynthesis protein (TIGR04326 family)